LEIGPEELTKLLKVLLDKKKEEPRLCTFDVRDSWIYLMLVLIVVPIQAQGKFSEDDLALVLYAAIESPAGAFRGLNTPESLWFIEVLEIQQALSWGLTTFNKFREFISLKRTFIFGAVQDSLTCAPGSKSFEEWSNNLDIMVCIFSRCYSIRLLSLLLSTFTASISPP